MLARLSNVRSTRIMIIGVLGLLLVTPLVVGSLAARAEAAKPNGDFSVPPGTTVTFSNLAISACNTESGGFEVNGSQVQTLADNAGIACSGPQQFPDVTWTNTSGTPVTLSLSLTDSTCGVTYYSNGTSSGGTVSVNHATFSRDAVSIADAGTACSLTDTVVQPTLGQGNFDVTLTFTHH